MRTRTGAGTERWQRARSAPSAMATALPHSPTGEVSAHSTQHSNADRSAPATRAASLLTQKLPCECDLLDEVKVPAAIDSGSDRLDGLMASADELRRLPLPPSAERESRRVPLFIEPAAFACSAAASCADIESTTSSSPRCSDEAEVRESADSSLQPSPPSPVSEHEDVRRSPSA